MKFTIIPSATGVYCTANGKTVSLETATAGKDYISEAACATDLKLTARDLFFARKTKLTDLTRAAEQPVTAGGFRLLSDSDSQTEFTKLVTLLQLARDAQPNTAARNYLLGMNLSAISGPIIDADGAARDMTVAQAFSLVLAYGQAIGAARYALQQKVIAVKAATTVEAVQAI